MKEDCQRELIENRVEDLAKKMVRARQVREQAKQAALSRQRHTENLTKTQENFFLRKATEADAEV